MNRPTRAHAVLLTLLAVLLAGLAGPGRAAATNFPPQIAYQTQESPLAQIYVDGSTPVALVGGNDDGYGDVTLPFPVNLYGTSYPTGTTLKVSVNGTVQFGVPNAPASEYANGTLPTTKHPGPTLFPYWDDLSTSGVGEGIFTKSTTIQGTPIFVVEWRTHLVANAAKLATFELILIGQGGDAFFYGYKQLDDQAAGATIGLQQGSDPNAPSTTVDVNTADPDLGGVFVGTGNSDISGLDQVGEVDSVFASGLFTGFPTPALTYQWSRCPDSGPCVDIPGATGATYTATPADQDQKLRVHVVATNSSGSAFSDSFETAAIAPTASPAPVYTIHSAAGTGYVAGTTDLGGHSSDGNTKVTLPFPVSVYGHSYTTALASSYGSLKLGSTPSSSLYGGSACLPNDFGPNVVEVLQGNFTSLGAGHGIYSATTGAAPHRTFVVEWRLGYASLPATGADFELVLHEGSPVMTAVYHTIDPAPGIGPVIGIQHGGGHPFTQFSCGTIPAAGSALAFDPSRPVISGTARAGSALHQTQTVVTGDAPLDDTSVWRRCDANGLACATTGTGASYLLGAADIGHTIRVHEVIDGPTGTAIVDSDPTALVAAAPPPPRDRTAPKLTSFRATPDSFRAGSAAKLSFRLSEASGLVFHVRRASTGRTVGRKCAKLTSKNAQRKHCTILTTLRGSFTAKGKAGANALTYKGTLGGKKLTAGSYRLVGTPTDAAKNKGKAVSLSFRILAPKKVKKPKKG